MTRSRPGIWAAPTKEKMNFGKALEILKSGGKVERAGWNGKGMWLLLVDGTPDAVLRDGTPYAKALGADHPSCEILPHIDMWTTNASGRRAMLPGWLASQSDMLAEDWRPTQDSVVVNVVEPQPTGALPPHQQRVVDERTELDDKLSKLVGFFLAPLFSTLPGAEQDRMRAQAVAMRTYSGILRDRIAAF